MEEESNIKVYIKIDSAGKITDVNSNIFLSDVTDWIEIDEGTGDKYAHAQGNYFEKPLTDDNGIYRYKYLGGAVYEKTEAEIEAEIAKIPVSPPSETELLKAQLKAVVERNEFIEDCIAEMAMQIYQ